MASTVFSVVADSQQKMMDGVAAPTQFLNKALMLEAFDGTIDHSELTTAAVMYNNSKKTNARLTRTLVALIGLLFMAMSLLARHDDVHQCGTSRWVPQ